ncbi:chromate transporter [Synechococcus lacustris]|uniref:chromate transporter n=1 Tax=Synechococcus lacustris TaxID=2116544 RepID=UPI0020CF4443|nr:chromate transporter [Synechococcus lacustris]MCP9793976.1 chromate transporter [Synechococcus lacustris L1F-Slac]MCP9813151.1 chromate transporter [Synechococcus lacustris L1E-Slac]
MTGLDTLWQVIKTFLGLSLFSLGGGNTLLQEYQHLSVDTYHWITNNQFADLYALAEAAPGPSSMIVGLLGLGAGLRHGVLWGVLTGLAAEIAVLLPSTLLMVAAALSWGKFKDSPFRIAFERGLGPITLGILFSVGLTVLRTADHHWLAYVVSFLVCGFMLFTRISPLYFMAIAGLLGGFGLIQR